MRWLALLLLAAPAQAGKKNKGPPAPPLPEPTEAPQPHKTVRAWKGPIELARMRFVAVGDFIPHTNVRNSAKSADAKDGEGKSTNNGGYDALFERITPYLSGADLTLMNLETPVTTWGGSRAFVFNAPPPVVDAVAKSGVDVVTIANNHVYDQGTKGLVDTRRLLDEKNMPAVGGGGDCQTAWKPAIFERNGISVGIIGITDLFNDKLDLNAGPNDPCAATLDARADLSKALKALDTDVKMLTVHWGKEYETAPKDRHVKAAHELIDEGFDVIVGHHPHVVQPLEVYEAADGRIGVIAYSLGNFVSNQSYAYVHGVSPDDRARTRDGLALQLDLVRKDYGKGPDGRDQIRVEVANVRGVPLWTFNSATKLVEKDPIIRAVVIDEALQELRKELDSTTDAERALQIKKRIAMYEDRLTYLRTVVGPLIETK